MGQFLAVGITTNLSISKEKAEKEKITLDEAIQNLNQNKHFLPEIYDFTDEKGLWKWSLKQEIIEAELLDFLKALYPLLYISKKYTDYDEVLEKLSQTNASSWIELANAKSFESFQIDEYGESERLYFDEKPFQPKLTVDFTSIALAMEGKIMMEVYGGLFNFFKISLQKAFPEFQLSKALRVYISG